MKFKQKIGILFGAALLTVTATGCSSFASLGPVQLNDLEINAVANKTFVQGDVLAESMDLSITGVYFRNRTKAIPTEDVTFTYVNKDTGVAYDFSSPIPQAGNYTLKAEYQDIVSSVGYDFSAVSERVYAESIELEEPLDEEFLRVAPGQSKTISFNVNPTNYTEAIGFVISDPSLAEVVRVNKTTFEVKGKKDGRLELDFNLRINPKEIITKFRLIIIIGVWYLTSLDVNGHNYVSLGETTDLNVLSLPTYANYEMPPVKAESANPSIADVEIVRFGTYRVTGYKQGETTIYFYGKRNATSYITRSFKITVYGPTSRTEDTIDKGLSDSETQYNLLFDYSSKIEIELDFTNQAIYNLAQYGHPGNDYINEYYKWNEMYHPCLAKITINGMTNVYCEVGARMKGNTSRDIGFVDYNGKFVPNHFCHLKLNFSQTFDKSKKCDYYVRPWTDSEAKAERKNRTFGGMKKLDLKWNKNYDNTYTKEAYAGYAFREEGILAQHSNLVLLTLKTETDSRTESYLLLESVDETMMQREFNIPSGDLIGDLYKCTHIGEARADLKDYSDGRVGFEGTKYRPLYDKKYNDEVNDFSSLTNFIDAINSTKTKSGEEFYNVIKNYMDVDNFLKYSAMCWVLGLPDDFKNNFNNYYLYFHTNGLVYFLAYDNDRCLGILQDWPKNCSSQAWDDKTAIGDGENGTDDQSPLVFRLTTGGSDHSWPVHQASKDKYYQYCLEYAQRYLRVTRFRDFTNQFKHAPSTNINEAGGTTDPRNMKFEDYARAKLTTLGLVLSD